MVPPPGPLESRLGQQIRERYQIYANAGQNLTDIDSQLHSSLFVMGMFEKVIRRGLGGLPVRQQQDIALLVDGLHLIGVCRSFRFLLMRVSRLDKQLSRFPRNESLI